MQASRRPRRSFAAPLVIISAAAAAPGCIVSSTPSNSKVTTKDHRTTQPTTEDHTTGPGSAIHNPPVPSHDNPDDPTSHADTNAPDETGQGDVAQTGEAPNYQRNWNIELQADGSCLAYLQVACKKGQTCNPPRPMEVSCPKGITADGPMSVYASSGSWDCYVMPKSAACPEKATCNPPPPKKTACPK